MDIPSYLLGKKAGGGSSTLQSKNVTITENGTTNVTADAGYDGLSNVGVTVNGILDTSDANAAADDMAISKTAYVNGTKVTGNVPVGSSSVATNYSASDVDIYLDDLQVNTEQGNRNQMFRTGDKISVYTPLTDVATVVGATANKIKKDEVICGVTGTYEGGSGPAQDVAEKDVNFYDYDGTRVYSYTKSQFNALESMPELPTHSGLTAQKWNWTLTDAKNFMNTKSKLDIGALYITDDNKTRIYITLTEDRKSPYLGLAFAGSIKVEWGDGNNQTISGSGTSTVVNTQHNYSKGGDYVITIEPLTASTDIYILGDSNGSKLISSNPTTAAENRDFNLLYRSCVKKIELGKSNTQTRNITIGQYGLKNLINLETIVIPHVSSSASSYTYAFDGCFNLKCVVFPEEYTMINNYYFQNCHSLKNVICPKSITIIRQNAFYYCEGLKHFVCPPEVTTINSETFRYCYSFEYFISSNLSSLSSQCFATNMSAKYYDFTACTSVPSGGATMFANIPSDCKIVVPDSLYETWIATSNWSTYSSNIIKKTDWEAL